MIEWRKPELDYIDADCSALVCAACKEYLNSRFRIKTNRRDTMLYEEFTRLTKCEDITYTFYKDVIEPMYIAAPEEIDKKTFCFMLDERFLNIAQSRYFDIKSSVSPLENERCERLAKMLHDLALPFDKLKDNPYQAGTKSWDLWECTIRHLEALKNA